MFDERELRVAEFPEDLLLLDDRTVPDDWPLLELLFVRTELDDPVDVVLPTDELLFLTEPVEVLLTVEELFTRLIKLEEMFDCERLFVVCILELIVTLLLLITGETDPDPDIEERV